MREAEKKPLLTDEESHVTVIHGNDTIPGSDIPEGGIWLCLTNVIFGYLGALGIILRTALSSFLSRRKKKHSGGGTKILPIVPGKKMLCGNEALLEEAGRKIQE